MTTHLLIVDDSERIRTSLRALLDSVAGISSIREASALSDALVSVQTDPPTLVILDMSLPDGLGMDIIEPLKLLAPTVLIAMLTIHSHDVFRRHCLTLGADWFFDKFTDIDALLEAVSEHAARNLINHGGLGTISP